MFHMQERQLLLSLVFKKTRPFIILKGIFLFKLCVYFDLIY